MPLPPPAPAPYYTHAGGRCSTWRSMARVCCAELVATALLVLLSGAGAGAEPTAAAVAGGLVVAALVQCFGSVSGAQMNPCVSLAAAWWGRMSPHRALAEMAAQLAGATLGAAARTVLASHPAAADAVTRLAPHYPVYKALAVEGVCGASVVLANCAQWHSDGSPDTWPLRIGAVVSALAVFATPLTGASMNPARSFGPALLAASWDRHWVYWAGPLAGAAAAVALYRGACCRPAPLSKQ